MSGRPRLALATYEKAPRLAPDDQRLIPALDRAGIHAEPAVWSGAASWESFDGVVIRSCWDYHRRSPEFHGWLDRLEAGGVALWNAPPLVRWNADKRYLVDLAARGIATIPTVVVPRGRGRDVGAVAAAEGWPRLVVKPAVSASAYETHVLTTPLDEAALGIVARLTSAGDTLVQPFIDEVSMNGEYSFVFLDGVLSHVTIKRAAAGEFRVQTEYGGSVSAIDPPAAIAEQATRAMAALPVTPLYARVDGVARGSAFLLMELELIEPNLFLGHSPGAHDRMAGAIARRLATR